jgi:hypothetical protein
MLRTVAFEPRILRLHGDGQAAIEFAGDVASREWLMAVVAELAHVRWWFQKFSSSRVCGCRGRRDVSELSVKFVHCVPVHRSIPAPAKR